MSKPRIPLHIKTDPESAADWREMLRTLRERKTLTRGDGPLIEMYCEKRKAKREALKHLDDEGFVRDYSRFDSNGVERTTEKHNLWWKISQDCDRQILAALDRLGVSPLLKDRPKRGTEPAPKQAPEPEANVEESLSPVAQELMKKLKAESEAKNG
jgi:phage terminase small subunit